MFTGAGVLHLYPALERRTWELLCCLERRKAASHDGTVDFATAAFHWSYDFMGDMVFGGCNSLEMMKNGDPEILIIGEKQAMIILDSGGQSPWLMDIIWNIPLGKHMHKLQKVAQDMMRTRVQVATQPPLRDLASYLIEDGTISQDDLELDAVIAMQGGSEFTSIAVTLAIYFLLAEPRYYQTLRAELEKTFQDPLGPPNASELAALPFFEGVIHESLRLGSPFFLPRVVPAGGAFIDGKFVPEHTVVVLAAYTQQISPDNFFPDPMSFRPEHWKTGGLGPETRTNKAAIHSFSSGPHVCIAKAFAYKDMRYVLARLVLALDMSLANSFDVKAFRDGILNTRTTILEEELVVKVKRRPGIDLEMMLH